ncbi:MAG: AAA family ATPase [Methylococcaceae bacterium]|nr:AAA family ATPase [Methylococcaceae bacterium]
MLNSLDIKNFRSLESFQVKKLGQVNLIVGKNNSGKSSVLEALRIYAGSANKALLENIAQGHNEKYRLNEDEETNAFDTALPFEDLFTGRAFPDNDLGIVIGEVEDSTHSLSITHGFLAEEEEISTDELGEEVTRIRRIVIDKSEFSDFEYPAKDVLIVKKGQQVFLIDFTRTFPHFRRFSGEMNSIPCSVIPTQFISMDELAKEWDAISLTEGEEIVKQALRIVLPEFEDLSFVNDTSNKKPSHRLAKVKITKLPRPVSLNSLGDGMLRILQLVLKVFSAKGGFLLIDEFENGLHYSVQEKVWTLLFTLAKDLEIQIFATTHSWDCIESFSKVATENKTTEGVLFRVGKSVRSSDEGRVIATVFDKEQLYNITQSDVEVR